MHTTRTVRNDMLVLSEASGEASGGVRGGGIVRVNKGNACNRKKNEKKPQETLERKQCPHRAVGADGGEGVGSAGKQPVPVHQQHPDVVLALLLC